MRPGRSCKCSCLPAPSGWACSEGRGLNITEAKSMPRQARESRASTEWRVAAFETGATQKKPSAGIGNARIAPHPPAGTPTTDWLRRETRQTGEISRADGRGLENRHPRLPPGGSAVTCPCAPDCLAAAPPVRNSSLVVLTEMDVKSLFQEGGKWNPEVDKPTEKKIQAPHPVRLSAKPSPVAVSAPLRRAGRTGNLCLAYPVYLRGLPPGEPDIQSHPAGVRRGRDADATPRRHLPCVPPVSASCSPAC
jgi:hypothetical protein